MSEEPMCHYCCAPMRLDSCPGPHGRKLWMLTCTNPECRAIGPDFPASDAPEIAHHRISRPLVWLSEPPKVPGDYHVEFGPNHKGIEYFSEADIKAKSWRPSSRRFAGPIPEPVEPEGGE